MEDARNEPICIVGSGAAGLITAHTLLQDGFKDVQIISRDAGPGGVWAQERVYDGLFINKCVLALLTFTLFLPLGVTATDFPIQRQWRILLLLP